MVLVEEKQPIWFLYAVEMGGLGKVKKKGVGNGRQVR
jgi:hypothetical protein